MASILIQMQQDITDRLLADPFFEDIPVLSRKKKETLNELQNRINKFSVAVMVVIPSATVKHPNVPGPYFEDIKIQVGICENRQVNATGKEAEEIAEHVAAILHHYIPEGLSEAVVCDQPTIVEIPPETEADRNKRLLAVNFTTPGGLAYSIPVIATPVVVNNAGTITLTCATALASIIYSTNGKHPSPRAANAGDATRYTTPFIPGAGLALKVRAWLAGYEASALVTTTT